MMRNYYSKGRENLFHGRFWRFPSKLIMQITKDLLEQISDLNKHNIIHNDIKPANIVYDKNNGKYRLIDFDLSMKVNKKTGKVIDKYCGTRWFSGAEIKKNNVDNVYSKKTDIWSLAMVICWMMFGGGNHIYYFLKDAEYINECDLSVYNFQYEYWVKEKGNEKQLWKAVEAYGWANDGYDDLLINMLYDMIKVDPDERKSAQQLLSAWFNSKH